MGDEEVRWGAFFFGPRSRKWIGFLAMTLVLIWVDDTATAGSLATAS